MQITYPCHVTHYIRSSSNMNCHPCFTIAKTHRVKEQQLVFRTSEEILVLKVVINLDKVEI